MKISDEILDAVSRAAEHYGNVSQLAKTMGVAHSTILFWRTGKTTSMSGKLWNTKVKPVLAPFMAVPRMVSETSAPYLPAPPSAERSAPIISLEMLNDYDPSLESITCFLRMRSHCRHAFSCECPPGSFCFSVGPEFRSLFPEGAYILALKRHPESGSMILAKLRETGEILICRFLRKDSNIVLEPLSSHPKGRNLSWDVAGRQSVLCWGFPLIEMNMSLAVRDDGAEESRI